MSCSDLAFDRSTCVQARDERKELLAAIENEQVPESTTQQALRAVQTWLWSPPADPPRRKVNHGWPTGPIIEEAGMTAFAGQADVRSLESQTEGTTNEQIYPSVAYRVHKTKSDALKYEPKALAGWTRRKCLSGPGFEDFKDGKVMPEYKIALNTEHDNVERSVVHKDAYPYPKELDRVNFDLKDEDLEREGRSI